MGKELANGQGANLKDQKQANLLLLLKLQGGEF
jgi:hypothetical protein